jgi:hypothetical protein
MVPDDSQKPWAAAQREAWNALVGSTITRWIGMDESVGSGDDDVVFLDRGSPFQVLWSLRAECVSGLVFDLTTRLDPDAVGELSLRLSDGRPLPRSKWNREADLSHLPTGRVEAVEFHLDDYERDGWPWHALVEALIAVGGRELLVIAAEVMWDSEGPKNWWGEEDVYVFAEPAKADAVEWHRNGRRFTVASLDDWPPHERVW